MNPGIDRMCFHVPRYFLDLRELAARRGAPPDKYLKGLGQERMAVPAPDEDVVTMATEAASRALADLDPAGIDTLLFATESGIDQAKAAGIYVHRLLRLPASCKVLEVKQACCSGAAALLLALAWVRMYPRKKVLLVASDVARYGLGAPAEPTQGAAAMALVVSARPRLLAVEPAHGVYTEDVMDFWRPNHRDEALVDGKLSIRIYLKALAAAWRDYREQGGAPFAGHHRFCYHLPLTRMAEKAHAHLEKVAGDGGEAGDGTERYASSLHFNRVIGNSYTASLFMALCSLLEHEDDLAGRRVGLFSYGSGCEGLFLSGLVREGYRHHLDAERHRALLTDRIELTVDRYEAWYREQIWGDGNDRRTACHAGGAFRLAGVENHQRLYEACPAAEASAPAAAPRSEGVRSAALA